MCHNQLGGGGKIEWLEQYVWTSLVCWNQQLNAIVNDLILKEDRYHATSGAIWEVKRPTSSASLNMGPPERGKIVPQLLAANLPIGCKSPASTKKSTPYDAPNYHFEALIGWSVCPPSHNYDINFILTKDDGWGLNSQINFKDTSCSRLCCYLYRQTMKHGFLWLSILLTCQLLSTTCKLLPY